jgi:Amt family ammonium transporter
LIRFKRRIDPIYLLNGTVVGMAGITPASGYIEIWAAVVLGFVLGLIAYGSLMLFKMRWRIDDALDVGSIHGVPGGNFRFL